MIMKVMEYIFGRCIDGTDLLNQTKFVYRWDLFLLTSVQLEVSYRTNLKAHFESGLKKQRPCRCIHWIYCCIYCCSSWGPTSIWLWIKSTRGRSSAKMHKLVTRREICLFSFLRFRLKIKVFSFQVSGGESELILGDLEKFSIYEVGSIIDFF